MLVPRRCSDAGETYVDNDDEATCILNSDTGGYDYSQYDASHACPYPAGATEHLGRKERRSDIKGRATKRSSIVCLGYVGARTRSRRC